MEYSLSVSTELGRVRWQLTISSKTDLPIHETSSVRNTRKNIVTRRAIAEAPDRVCSVPPETRRMRWQSSADQKRTRCDDAWSTGA